MEQRRHFIRRWMYLTQWLNWQTISNLKTHITQRSTSADLSNKIKEYKFQIKFKMIQQQQRQRGIKKTLFQHKIVNFIRFITLEIHSLIHTIKCVLVVYIKMSFWYPKTCTRKCLSLCVSFENVIFEKDENNLPPTVHTHKLVYYG